MSTPLTDAINALTAYANQVTSASDTNLSDAVYTLVQGYGGGGGVTPPLVVEEIVVGENTVTNMVSAHDYFFSTTENNQIVILKETASTNNQLISQFAVNVTGNLGGYGLRYRNGSIALVNISSSYDAILIPGTTYYKIYLQ